MKTEKELRKIRVTAIASELVASQVIKGELDPDDEGALRAATREAVETAIAVHDAAMEYLS